MARSACRGAGFYRHPITVQAVTEARDAYGGTTQTYSTAFRDFARIEPILSGIAGGEDFESQHVQPEITFRVWMRYRSGLTHKHRILYGSRVLEIERIINLNEMNRELVITAIERP